MVPGKILQAINGLKGPVFDLIIYASTGNSWQKTTVHVSRRTFHGLKRQLMETLVIQKKRIL